MFKNFNLYIPYQAEYGRCPVSDFSETFAT